jgi:hypothetical protein
MLAITFNADIPIGLSTVPLASFTGSQGMSGSSTSYRSSGAADITMVLLLGGVT